jgi:hypothetical protein
LCNSDPEDTPTSTEIDENIAVLERLVDSTPFQREKSAKFLGNSGHKEEKIMKALCNALLREDESRYFFMRLIFGGK